MKTVAGRLRLSPTDLGNFVACRHLSALDLALAAGTITPPDGEHWFSAALQRRGEQHERAYVAHLLEHHGSATDLSACRFDREGFRATRAAMARGDAVILQAPLGDGISLQPQSVERSDLACPVCGDPGRESGAVRTVVPDAPADAVGERILSVCGDGDVRVP
jgi:hypothetical protein